MPFERRETRRRFKRLAVLGLGLAVLAGAQAGAHQNATAKPPAGQKPKNGAKTPKTDVAPEPATIPATTTTESTQRPPTPVPTPTPAPEPVTTTGYRIGPADTLQINVWKEPDLTREFEVRLDGMITLPLVGDLLAAGRTPSQLAEALTKSLERFVEAPRVTVGVRANSARFYVVGQVTKSGEFPLTGRTTVVQGLALAGGFKEFAKTEGIVIIRQDQTVIQVNYKRIAEGKEVSQNVFLAPGDTVVVP